MARYFFDIDGDEQIADDEGIETLNPDIVPGTAFELLLRTVGQATLANGLMMSVTVRDASDHVVYRAALTFVEASFSV